MQAFKTYTLILAFVLGSALASPVPKAGVDAADYPTPENLGEDPVFFRRA
ncbi:hypothetical protein GGR54DRAFT_642698 [Hypoxylon sp. NC1633]|nr:hypothetical protein GGR54DRAFT_642698 [Hypoxylon sp. NC1633]